jgi:hypothetical protein
MARHGYIEHVAKRRLFGRKPIRCVCGNGLPCMVAASIARQRFFTPEAAPAWNGPTRMVPAADIRPAARQPGPPLLTPGQRDRSSQGGRW